MPQESTPCLPPCQCHKPKRTSAGKGTQANGEEALLYPAERFCGWGKTGSENGRDRTNITVPSALSGTCPLPLPMIMPGKGNTCTAQLYSLKRKEAHSRKKPGIALDAAGSA